MNTRREFVASLLALWQTAQIQAAAHHHTKNSPAPTPYQFTFLNPASRHALQNAMALLIPSDNRSGGALAARVDEYVDFILTHADPTLQQTWRTGLASLAKAPDIDRFLTQQARNEFSPQTNDEIFFVLLKQAVTAGFFTSAEGIEKELAYQGMTFALEFEGCTHAEHHAPANWTPLLRQRKDA